MTDIEKTTFKDDFRLLLLVTEVNPSRNHLEYHARLFEGGVCAQEQHVCAPYGAADDSPYRTLQGVINKVASEPHILVCAGRGWTELLLAFMAEAAIDALRILDLRASAAALLPDVKVSSFPDGFAAALGLSWQTDDNTLPVQLIEDLMWGLIHEAGTRELDWPSLLEYAVSSRHTAPFDRFRFDAAALAEIPSTPGIYVMRDRKGATLYVGKSANLNARVNSYFSAQKTVPQKIQKIWDQIADLDLQLAGSDLEALLMEQQLIATLTPAVNIQRTVAEGRSRYGSPSTTVVLLLPSARTSRLEMFWLGIAGATYQLRVNPARPPITQLRQLLTATRNARAPRRASRNLINWGPQGNEIASRHFGRHRTRLTWLETGDLSVDEFIAQVTQLMKNATKRQLGPAEIRLHEAG